MSERIIETRRIKVKLLDGSTLDIRPLTLAERRECIKKVPGQLTDLSKIKDEQFAEKYIDVQRDLVHFLITRSSPDFKIEDVETKLDTSIIEQIVLATLKDPLQELLQW